MSASAFLAAASVTPMDVPSGMRISMKSSGRDDVGKNCCCTCVKAAMAGAEGSERQRDDHPAEAHGPADGAAKSAIEARVVDVVAGMPGAVLGEVGQQLDADVGREEHGHDPRDDEREPDDPEDVAGILAGGRARDADRQEADGRHERAGQHGERGRIPGERRGAHAAPALLHFDDHHLDGDDRIVDEQAERDDERAERDAVEIEPGHVHDDEDDREHERHRRRHHEAGAPSERDEADDEHDGERLDERAQELADRLLDDARLVRDLVDLDAGRNLRFGIRNRILELLAELQNVGALGHGDDDADGFAAVVAHDAARRVLVAALDGGDVAEPERRAAGLDRHFRDGRLALERAGDAHVDAVGAGLDACRRASRHSGAPRCRRWPAA